MCLNNSSPKVMASYGRVCVSVGVCWSGHSCKCCVLPHSCSVSRTLPCLLIQEDTECVVALICAHPCMFMEQCCSLCECALECGWEHAAACSAALQHIVLIPRSLPSAGGALYQGRSRSVPPSACPTIANLQTPQKRKIKCFFLKLQHTGESHSKQSHSRIYSGTPRLL